MYNALQKKEAPKVDPAPAPSAKETGKKNGLKSMSYGDQKVALKPKAGAHGGLSPAEIQAAVKYNNKRGYSVAEIKKFQKEVGTSADGVFGPNTVKAIAKFQGSQGLSVDGKIGPKTEKALNAAIAQGQKPDKPKPDKPKPDKPPVESGNLTAHFSLSEFKSKDGAKTPASVIPHLKELAENLEVLRAAVGGKSITINSGYRSPAHNAAVGGAKNSQHVQGKAADIVVSGMTPSQVKAKIEQLINQGKMKQGGIGKYSSFVHYDTRGYAARW